MQSRFGRNKYGAIKTVVNGIKFDSKREASRYIQLKALVESGFIRDLILQPKFTFPIFYDSKRPVTYRADFSYVADDIVVEDVKGMITPEFKIKKALMAHFFGIDVVVVK